MKGTTPAIVGLALLLTAACGAPQTTPPTHGSLSFTVELVDGSTFDLATHQEETGNPVVINLWASWCVPCRKEMPAIDRVARSHPDVTIIGVAVQDRPEKAARFAREIGVGYPLAVDRDQAVEALFRIPGLPMSVFVSPQGEIVGTTYGEMDESDLEEKLFTFFG